MDDGEMVPAIRSVGGFTGRDSKPPLGEGHYRMN